MWNARVVKEQKCSTFLGNPVKRYIKGSELVYAAVIKRRLAVS